MTFVGNIKRVLYRRFVKSRDIRETPIVKTTRGIITEVQRKREEKAPTTSKITTKESQRIKLVGGGGGRGKGLAKPPYVDKVPTETITTKRSLEPETKKITPATTEKESGVVSLPPQDPFSRLKSYIYQKGGEPFSQLTTPFISTAEFAVALKTQPRLTLASVGLSIGRKAEETGKFLFQKRPQTVEPPFAEIGKLAQKPEAFTGRLVGEFALGAALFKPTQLAAESVGGLTRAGATRISPTFRPLITRATELGFEEQVITKLPRSAAVKEIILIPEGKGLIGGTAARRLDILSPSLRGGFGFTKAEQLAISKAAKGVGVTAQRSLVSPFKQTIKLTKPELYATPLVEGKAYIRVSRAGLQKSFGESVAGFKDIGKAIKNQFEPTVTEPVITFFRQKPQAIIVEKGLKGIGYKSSTELETTIKKTQVPELKVTQRYGATLIGGQRISIAQVRPLITKAGKTAITGGIVGKKLATSRIGKGLFGSYEKTGLAVSEKVSVTPRISPYGLGTLGSIKISSFLFRKTTPLKPTVSLTTQSPQYLSVISTSYPFSPTGSGRGGGGRGGRATPSPIVSSPIITRLPVRSPVRPSPPIRQPVRPTPIVIPFSSEEMFRPTIFRKKKKKKGKKVPRQPSLVAIFEGIKARKPRRSEISSLTIRPILIGGKKRGKKKKR